MAVKAFPLENVEMLDTEWRQIFKNLYQGVATGLEVTADGGGMRVFVAAGEGGVAGHGVKVTSTEQLSIESTGSARTARIVLDPDAPHLKVRYSAPTATQYQLATVNVAANAVTIAPSDVSVTARPVMDELKTALAIVGADIGGTLNEAQIPNLNANKITAGTLPLTRGGTGAGSASGARQNLRIFVQSSRPSSPQSGDVRFW